VRQSQGSGKETEIDCITCIKLKRLISEDRARRAFAVAAAACDCNQRDCDSTNEWSSLYVVDVGTGDLD